MCSSFCTVCYGHNSTNLKGLVIPSTQIGLKFSWINSTYLFLEYKKAPSILNWMKQTLSTCPLWYGLPHPWSHLRQVCCFQFVPTFCIVLCACAGIICGKDSFRHKHSYTDLPWVNEYRAGTFAWTCCRWKSVAYNLLCGWTFFPILLISNDLNLQIRFWSIISFLLITYINSLK